MNIKTITKKNNYIFDSNSDSSSDSNSDSSSDSNSDSNSDSSSDSSSDSDSSINSDNNSKVDLKSDIVIKNRKIISFLGDNNKISLKVNNQLNDVKYSDTYIKIHPSIKNYNKIFYLSEKNYKVMYSKNNKYTKIGYFMKFSQNEEKNAPFIFSGEKYTIVKKINYKKYLLQLCVLTNKVYYPNKNGVWIHVANYNRKNKTLKWFYVISSNIM